MNKATFLVALAMGLAIIPSSTIRAGTDDGKTAAAEKVVGEKSSSAEKLLTDKGLTRDDRKFLLDGEGEAIEKFKATQAVYADLQKVMNRYSTIMQYDEMVQGVAMQSQALQQEINNIQGQISSSSRGYGRMRQMQSMTQAPMRQQQTQDRAMMNQVNNQLKTLKSQGPKPGERQAIPLEYERLRKSYMDSVRELDEVVTPLLKQYHELGTDKSVQDALADMRKSTTMNIKLGPSDQVLAASKVVKAAKKTILPRSKPSIKKTAKSK